MPTEDKPKEEKKASGNACGFENKQYFGDSGNKMTCVSEKNHAPEPVTRMVNGQAVTSMEVIHRAPYPEEGADPKVFVAFSDAAGTPPPADILEKIEAEKARKDAAKKAAEKK